MKFARREVRDVWSWMCSAFAEFSITSIYALSSILIGILLLRYIADNTWFRAISLNALQGELMIASIAMMGPLAYAVVADPPIKYKTFFQLVVLMYTLFAFGVYVANKLVDSMNHEFMVNASIVALVFSLVINYVATYINHSVKRPDDKMRDSTIRKAAAYAAHVGERR